MFYEKNDNYGGKQYVLTVLVYLCKKWDIYFTTSAIKLGKCFT